MCKIRHGQLQKAGGDNVILELCGGNLGTLRTIDNAAFCPDWKNDKELNKHLNGSKQVFLV